MVKNKRPKKQKRFTKLEILEANKRHDLVHGNPSEVLVYAKHIKGRSDITQKR